MLERIDDRGIGGGLQADAIREDVPHVGIGHEDLAERTNALVRRQESLAVGPAPLTAEQDPNRPVQERAVLTRWAAAS